MKAVFTHMPSGDKELFSLKAINRLMQADIVVSCPLIWRKITEFIREDCKLVARPEEISAIFSRDGRVRNILLVRIISEDAVNTEELLDEMIFFERAGFETEAIPGVSSIQALLAARCFPLTNRDTAQSFWVADGKHRKSDPAFYRELRNVAVSSATLVLRNASLLEDDVLAVIEAVRKENLWVIDDKDDDLLIIARRPERYYFTGGVFNSSSANRRSAGVLALKRADGSS